MLKRMDEFQIIDNHDCHLETSWPRTKRTCYPISDELKIPNIEQLKEHGTLNTVYRTCAVHPHAFTGSVCLKVFCVCEKLEGRSESRDRQCGEIWACKPRLSLMRS